MPKKSILLIAGAVVVVGGGAAWLFLKKPALPEGFAGGNGRLEAKQLFVSTKYPGRIKEVLVNEGDTVEAGQVVARMDTSALEAQLRAQEAKIAEAQQNAKVARTDVQVKVAGYDYSNKQYERSRDLVTRGAVSEQEAEIDNAKMLGSKAELAGSKANVAQVQSTIVAAQAEADRLRAEIKDSVLVAPVRARVETRLSEPGEVLEAGGRVFSLNDLSDVYMYVYLPEKVTGKIPLGSEARIVLDAAPEYPVRAFVSFVSPMAQFTPKTVETAEERHNLTFRVKLQIPQQRLRQFEPLVKVGLPGMGYVRWVSSTWPQKLQTKGAVPKNLWQAAGASDAPGGQG
jgi:HlyD family secretion protein